MITAMHFAFTFGIGYASNVGFFGFSLYCLFDEIKIIREEKGCDNATSALFPDSHT